MLSCGVKDTDHVANSCQTAAPLEDYSRPFSKETRQSRESGARSFFPLGSFISSLSSNYFFFLPCVFLSPSLSTLPLSSLQTHIREYLCKASWLLFETICQLCKTESWRWIPEVEARPFIRQFIHGTCQDWLPQIRHRVRQIRITKTETCLQKRSFSVCVFVERALLRTGLTAYRLPLIECDRFSH